MVLASLQTPNHGATCVFPSPGFEAGTTLKAVADEKYVISLLSGASAYNANMGGFGNCKQCLHHRKCKPLYYNSRRENDLVVALQKL